MAFAFVAGGYEESMDLDDHFASSPIGLWRVAEEPCESKLEELPGVSGRGVGHLLSAEVV